MEKKIMLPSLFVLTTFLVGLIPKTSKAGSVKTSYNPKNDSVVYNVDFDFLLTVQYDKNTGKCYLLNQFNKSIYKYII